jgi:hypothetical protein
MTGEKAIALPALRLFTPWAEFAIASQALRIAS